MFEGVPQAVLRFHLRIWQRSAPGKRGIRRPAVRRPLPGSSRPSLSMRKTHKLLKHGCG